VRRREFLRRSGGLLAALPTLASRPSDERPDVLLLVAGDVGWRDVAPHVHTPSLAALMRRGAVFRKAFSYPAGGLTSYGLHFGRHPGRDGILEAPNYYEDLGLPDPDPELPSLARVLKDAGYATGLFGKWNLGKNDRTERARTPELFGFDAWRAGVPGILLQGGGTGYEDWLRVDDGVETRSKEYQPTAMLAAFERWWRETPAPRFALCAFHVAHQPFHDPPGELVPKPPEPVKRSPRWRQRRKYEAMVQSLDTLAGRMIARVPQDACVVFTSDNGTPVKAGAFDQDPNKLKHTTFDGGVNVPLVVAGPGVAAGETDALVSLVDLPATLAELAGASPPDGFAVDSVSFRRTLRPRRTPVRTHVYADAKGEEFMVRTRTHKLRRLDATEELYDLRRDPEEAQPLAVADPANAKVLDELRAILDGPWDGR
jgi:arylsulfatase A-like enzyme